MPDTATIERGELTLRYRNVSGDEVEGVDELVFLPRPGAPTKRLRLGAMTLR